MRRIALIAAIAAVTGAGAAVAFMAAPAAAADQKRISGEFSYDDDTMCADPVRVSSTYDEMRHLYRAQDGTVTRLQFTGKVTMDYTDLVTGRTYSPNSSGPGMIDLSGETVARGGNGAIFTEYGFVATDGKLVIDADGNVVALPHHTLDVCVQLG